MHKTGLNKSENLGTAAMEPEPKEQDDNAASPRMRAEPKPMNLHFLTTAYMLSAAAFPWLSSAEQKQDVERVIAGMAGKMLEGLEAYKKAPIYRDNKDYPKIW